MYNSTEVIGHFELEVRNISIVRRMFFQSLLHKQTNSQTQTFKADGRSMSITIFNIEELGTDHRSKIGMVQKKN